MTNLPVSVWLLPRYVWKLRAFSGADGAALNSTSYRYRPRSFDVSSSLPWLGPAFSGKYSKFNEPCTQITHHNYMIR